MSLLGNKLIELRKSKTQKEVAKKLGISAQHLSNIENGKSSMSVCIMIKASKLLKYRTEGFIDLAVCDYENKLLNQLKGSF
jgi:transcriptional regulator with XRE-family HTH domain